MPKSRFTPLKRRNLHEIASLLDEFDSSKMSVAEFAELVGVSVATVYQWKRRLRESPGFQAANAPSSQSMVRVIATAEPATAFAPPPKRDSGVSFVLASGLICRVEQGFHEETLMRLVQLLAPDGGC